MSEYIGLNDKAGNRIHVGDEVEFYFDMNLGYSDVAHPDYTTMRDKVVSDGEDYFFLSDIGWASYAWRHNENCMVVDASN